MRTAVRALQAAGLQSRLPDSAEDVFRFRDEYVRQRNFKGRRLRRIQLASGPVQVLGIQDLIAMKRKSGRPQDLEDAAALEKLA